MKKRTTKQRSRPLKRYRFTVTECVTFECFVDATDEATAQNAFDRRMAARGERNVFKFADCEVHGYDIEEVSP